MCSAPSIVSELLILLYNDTKEGGVALDPDWWTCVVKRWKKFVKLRVNQVLISIIILPFFPTDQDGAR